MLGLCSTACITIVRMASTTALPCRQSAAGYSVHHRFLECFCVTVRRCCLCGGMRAASWSDVSLMRPVQAHMGLAGLHCGEPSAQRRCVFVLPHPRHLRRTHLVLPVDKLKQKQF